MKHYSKNYLGLLKQCDRQDKKESYKYIEITPVIMTYEDGNYQPLCKCVFNNKWNGINLNNLKNRENNLNYSHNSIDSKISFKNGKYCLSIKGKLYLKRKRENK